MHVRRSGTRWHRGNVAQLRVDRFRSDARKPRAGAGGSASLGIFSMTAPKSLVRLARGCAATAYVLGGVTVLSIAMTVSALSPMSVLVSAATASTFIATAATAQRLRRRVEGARARARPSWRELWPQGLQTAPMYSATLIATLYGAVAGATQIMSGDVRAAVLPITVAGTAFVLHRLVPEVLVTSPVPHTEHRYENTEI